MVGASEVENLEFKWVKQRGIGGRKKDVKFYESFIYDGVNYSLYDDVFLHNESEPYPYIGKLIKIWENPDKSKKVKVLWFFRPFEIKNAEFELSHSNEVFLASGEGEGVANVISLEAISGKCNVVCISKDSRNPNPSNEELQMADFVFYRTFNVDKWSVLDNIDDKIAGIDVKYFFNKEGSQKPCSDHNLGVDNGRAAKITSATNGRDISGKLNSSGNQICEDGKREKQKLADGKKLAANDRQENGYIRKNASSPKVEENSDVKVQSVKPNFSVGEKPVSGVGAEPGELTNTNDRQENTSGKKICLSHKVKEHEDLKVPLVEQENPSIEKIGKVGKSFVNQVKVDEKLKSTKDSGEVDERPHKKAKLNSTVKLSNDKNRNNVLNPNRASDSNNPKPSVPNITASEDKSKHAVDSLGIAENSSKKLKVDEKLTKPTNVKKAKESPAWPPNDGLKTGDKAVAVTSRPDSDRSKWFTELPWEERIQNANEQGRLVLFQNLDPCCTSAEVEDLVWSAFRETCRAKMVQRTAYSSPHSAQAFIIFKTSEAAEQVVAKLDKGCLLLSNRRPLVASMANPCFPRKQSTFVGHIILDKLKPQREMKEAVSTSHSSQPNTLEYEMAMEWCLLVERSDQFWKGLYKRQGEELEKLKASFKSK